VPAGCASAQVHPPRTDLEALQAAIAAGWGWLDSIKVAALVHHVYSLECMLIVPDAVAGRLGLVVREDTEQVHPPGQGCAGICDLLSRLILVSPPATVQAGKAVENAD
jgi:hypothetical protein